MAQIVWSTEYSSPSGDRPTHDTMSCMIEFNMINSPQGNIHDTTGTTPERIEKVSLGTRLYRRRSVYRHICFIVDIGNTQRVTSLRIGIRMGWFGE